MMYKTILTNKGTTTIPIEIRKGLGVKAGDFTIKRSRTIEEIRTLNKRALDSAKTSHKDYESGNGFNAFTTQKNGE